MDSIVYINRFTGKREIENVYGEKIIKLLYGEGFSSSIARALFLTPAAKWPWVSALYGHLQKRKSSAKKIAPFIEAFGVDASEFLEPVESFKSFNDFFIRKLKPEARPFSDNPHEAIIPADARYYFYQDLTACDGFIVKGKKFSLPALLGSRDLAQEFEGGSLVLARLCPTDYHRFHFPCEGVPGPSQIIPGALYSVNPLAIRRHLDIFTENKRSLCVIETPAFGKMVYMEVGATNVGSIHQTYTPGVYQKKGQEKGYFSFGASALVLLFQKGRITLDQDLLDATAQGIEVRCLLGQKMGIGVPSLYR